MLPYASIHPTNLFSARLYLSRRDPTRRDERVHPRKNHSAVYALNQRRFYVRDTIRDGRRRFSGFRTLVATKHIYSMRFFSCFFLHLSLSLSLLSFECVAACVAFVSACVRVDLPCPNCWVNTCGFRLDHFVRWQRALAPYVFCVRSVYATTTTTINTNQQPPPLSLYNTLTTKRSNPPKTPIHQNLSNHRDEAHRNTHKTRVDVRIPHSIYTIQ